MYVYVCDVCVVVGIVTGVVESYVFCRYLQHRVCDDWGSEAETGI